MKKIKRTKKELITCVSNMFKHIKTIVKNVNKPSYANFIYITYFYFIVSVILLPIFIFITRKYNINSNNVPFDIYLALSTLMIPLAIFVAQKVSDSRDFLTANVYMNQSHIFPMTIFQIVSFVSLFYIQNIIYYWLLIIIYAIFISIMYIRTLRLFSDSIYFTKKLKEESKKIINDALNMHINSAENITKNEILPECGIYFENYHYENTDIYNKEYIYPPEDNLLIKELSQKDLNNLRNIMSQINIGTEELSKINSKNNMKTKKIIIFLQNEGFTTRIKTPIIKIFYNSTNKEVTDNLENIKNILYNLYKYEDYNLDIIVEKEIQEIETKCTASICNHSITELKNNLKIYVDFYKAIVDNISSNIDKNYTLEQVYKSTHSIYSFRGFKYFEYIREEIYNLCYNPNSLKNKFIFNEITSCIYEMLLYSYTQYELISFEYISNIYQSLTYLVNENKKLDMNKIQLELFEILDYIYYELRNTRNENYQISKNMIILLNKVIVNIMFELATKDVERYHVFRKKFIEFISNLEQEIKKVVNSQHILEELQEILRHCSSNLFVMDSYLFEKHKNDISIEIINFYKGKSFEYIILAFLNAHKLDFDSIYHWDSWERYDILNQDGAHFVNTGLYMNNLFCNICIKHNHVKFPIDRDLVSFYKSSLKNTLMSLGCNEESDLILKFENMLKKYDENGKKYLRETNISEDKKNDFIKKFLECYIRDNKLYNLMKKYNNTKIVNPSKRRRKLFRN